MTDGTGGQGLKLLPNVYDGWVQDTVALCGTGRLSAEVEGWIAALTPEQGGPSGTGGAQLADRGPSVGAPMRVRAAAAHGPDDLLEALKLICLV